MIADKPFLGILLMLAFCIVTPLGDAVAKLLGQTVPIGEFLLFRFAIQAALLIPLVWAGNRPWRMRRRVFYIVGLRTLMHLFGIGMMVTALKYLPLANAVSIVFVMPFMLLILGRFVLNEEIGATRLIACAVGFCGTLLVVQPSFATVGWRALLPLGVALNFSIFMLITRKIAKETDPIGLQAVSGIIAVVVLVPLLAFFSHSNFAPLALIRPSGVDLELLIAIGLIGTISHLLMIWSLRYAPSATLAPMQYLEIPVAALLGWMVFSDLPNPLTLLGISITMAAGLYVMITERANHRRLRPVPEAPAQPV
jgi:drug/metabolite transporter (DMT)-like permease